jgi:hypothetical protein
MTSLIGAKKRAEEFAAALEGQVAWTDVHPELADLAELVDGLRVHDPVEPSPEFTASLRERLLAEADEMYAQDAVLTLPERRHGRRERRFAIAAASLVFVGGTAGMAAAAQQALPGDALYPIKRGLEQAQAGLATSDEAKGRDLLSQADTRLAEIQQMVDGSSSPSQLPPTINAFTTQAQQGSKLLMQSYAQNQDQQSIEAVRSFTTHSLKVLQTVAGTAPADQQEELTRAAMTLLSIDGKAIQTCKSCAPDLPALQMPKLFAPTANATRALGRVANKDLSNDHPTLPNNLQPAPPADQQPGTGDGNGSGTGGTSGDSQPNLPGLPSGSGGTGGGDNTGSGSGGSHPLRDTIKGVTKGGDGVVPKDKGDVKNEVKSLLDPLLP